MIQAYFSQIRKEITQIRICNPKKTVTTNKDRSLCGVIALQMLILNAAELQIRLNGRLFLLAPSPLASRLSKAT